MDFLSIFGFPTANLTWLIVGLFSVAIYIYTKRDGRIQRFVDKFEGPLALPIVGTSFWFLRPNWGIVPLMFDFSKKYNSGFALWFGNQANIVINKAEDAEKILSSTIHTEKSTDYDVFHKWLGLGLLTAKPNKWHSRRKLLTPTFHFKILEEFLVVFNEHSNTFIDVLRQKEGNGRQFDVSPYITRCVLDIICETAMGKKVNAQKGQGLDYVEAIYSYGEILIKKILQPWLQVGWIWNMTGYGSQEKNYLKILHDFTENIIVARKSERKREVGSQSKDEVKNPSTDELLPKRRKAFLDLILDLADSGESGMTDLEIRNEVDTFMFEGHDTTAASLVWTLFLLGLYPEHQQKVQDELDDIFGDDKTRDLNAGDISKMKYLELCIKESLRLYPSVPFYVRHLNEDLDLGNQRVIPRGANVFIASILVHHDPIVFPDPESFKPERFLPEKCVGRNPYAYIPFSAGPRNCIGQKFALLEEKVILAKFLINFNIKSVQKQKEIRLVPDMILRPVDGIDVVIKPRV